MWAVSVELILESHLPILSFSDLNHTYASTDFNQDNFSSPIDAHAHVQRAYWRLILKLGILKVLLAQTSLFRNLYINLMAFIKFSM